MAQYIPDTAVSYPTIRIVQTLGTTHQQRCLLIDPATLKPSTSDLEHGLCCFKIEHSGLVCDICKSCMHAQMRVFKRLC